MLKRTISREYHRRNVGMYLVILLLAFGFLRGEEHIQLARIFMSRTELLLLIALLWGLHVIKSSLFFIKLMQDAKYEILFGVALLPQIKKIRELIAMQLSLNAIFFTYAMFMLFIGIVEKEWINVVILLGINLLYIVIPILWKKRVLKYPASLHKETKLSGVSLPQVAYPAWTFFTVYLFKKEPFYLLSQKLFAAFIITGMAYFYPTDDYDERLLKLGFFVVASGYFTLSQQYGSFYTEGLLFSRNLPLLIANVFVQKIINAVLFTLPELVLFISYLPGGVGVATVLDTYLFAISMAVFWQVAIFWINIQDSRLNLFLFVGHIGLVILLMFKIPLSVVGVVLLFISYQKLKRNYFRFEASED